RSQVATTIDEADEEQFLLLKLQLFEKLNRRSDARRLLQTKSNVKFFRLKLVEECLSENDLLRAKELIKEGKRLEDREGKFKFSFDWDRLLLRIAQQEGDVKTI